MIITMMTKVFEITVVDPLTDMEFQWLEAHAVENNYDVAVNRTGLILMIEGPESIYELAEFLGEHQFISDIGLIKESITYEPQYDEPLILVDLDDSM